MPADIDAADILAFLETGLPVTFFVIPLIRDYFRNYVDFNLQAVFQRDGKGVPVLLDLLPGEDGFDGLAGDWGRLLAGQEFVPFFDLDIVIRENHIIVSPLPLTPARSIQVLDATDAEGVEVFGGPFIIRLIADCSRRFIMNFLPPAPR